jgi:hypothetical protein
MKNNWTPEEDKKVLNSVIEPNVNMTKAFKAIAVEMNRTYAATQRRYYHLIDTTRERPVDYKKKERRIFTDSDIANIISMVKKYPTSRKKAFIEAGKLVDRPWDCVASYWYKKNGLKGKKIADTGGSGSSAGYSPNVKNNSMNTDGSIKELKYNGREFVMKLYLDLDENDKIKFLSAIKSLSM